MISSRVALHIEYCPIERLRQYPRNPRKNDAAVDRMIASISEFGFTILVLARSSGEVIDGHLRLKAAHKPGIMEIPVILCEGWTPAQVKAFRLKVNRSVTWAEWDDDLLGLELQDRRNLDFGLGLTGFDDVELARLLRRPASAFRGSSRSCSPPCTLGLFRRLGRLLASRGDAGLLPPPSPSSAQRGRAVRESRPFSRPWAGRRRMRLGRLRFLQQSMS